MPAGNVSFESSDWEVAEKQGKGEIVREPRQQLSLRKLRQIVRERERGGAREKREDEGERGRKTGKGEEGERRRERRIATERVREAERENEYHRESGRDREEDRWRVSNVPSSASPGVLRPATFYHNTECHWGSGLARPEIEW